MRGNRPHVTVASRVGRVVRIESLCRLTLPCERYVQAPRFPRRSMGYWVFGHSLPSRCPSGFSRSTGPLTIGGSYCFCWPGPLSPCVRWCSGSRGLSFAMSSQVLALEPESRCSVLRPCSYRCGSLEAVEYDWRPSSSCISRHTDRYQHFGHAVGADQCDRRTRGLPSAPVPTLEKNRQSARPRSTPREV